MPHVANEIIQSPAAPAYCSACFCAGGDKVYIDFDADCDRGYGDDPNHPVPMDTLILCESCVRSGAALVGMVPKSDSEREVSELRVKVDRLEREVRQAQRYSGALEDAFESRPQPIEIDHRRRPRHIKESGVAAVEA